MKVNRRALRRYRNYLSVQKQCRIERSYGLDKNAKGPKGIYRKRKATNCGNPKCVWCMNPRKAFGVKTLHELSSEEMFLLCDIKGES